MVSELDAFDRKILNVVQRDAAATAESIADMVGLSPSAVHRRLKRLRDTKAILSEIAVVDPKQVGRPLIFIASVEIERERPELLQQLRRYIESVDDIQQAYYVTGSADLIMVIVAASVEDYHEITARLIEFNPNVRRITTSVGLHTFKRGLFVPVSA